MNDATRVLVFGVGASSSGIPPSWAAAADRPGVALVPSLDGAAEIARSLHAIKRQGDIVVLSIHWGSNWGYGTALKQARFAHRLIDAGVDVIHGHSSHHPRRIEIYHRKLILYGCGDLINDYEGIAGHVDYRPNVRVAYFADIDPVTGDLHALRLAPMTVRRMRLWRAPREDCQWLHATLSRISVGCRIAAHADRELVVTRAVRR